MTQHTPGPWEIVSDAETLEFTVLSRDAIVGREICTLQFHDERSVGAKEANERQEANARLIAAAPDGLAANKMALAYIADELTETSRDEDPDAWAIVDALRAAISKATGEA